LKNTREQLDIITAYQELGSYRAAAKLCGTTAGRAPGQAPLHVGQLRRRQLRRLVPHVLSGDFSGGTGIHRSIALSIGVIAGAQAGAVPSQRVHGVVIQRLLALALGALAIRLLLVVL
jgi:hypothetical protein